LKTPVGKWIACNFFRAGTENKNEAQQVITNKAPQEVTTTKTEGGEKESGIPVLVRRHKNDEVPASMKQDLKIRDNDQQSRHGA